MKKDKDSLYAAFKKVIHVIPPAFRLRSVLVLLSLFANSILELLGLAMLVPMFSIVIDEKALQNSRVFSTLYHTIGFTSQIHFIFFLCGSIIFLMITKNILSILIMKFQASYAYSLYHYFSTSLQKYHYHKGFLHFKNHNSAYLLRDINVVPIYFSQNFILPLLMFTNELTVTAAIILTIIAYDIKIVVLLCLTVLPISVLAYRLVRKKIQGIGENKVLLSSDLSKNLQQSIHGYVDVKINNRETYFFDQYKRQVKEITGLQTMSYLLMAVPNKIVEVGTVLGITSIIIYGVLFIPDKTALSTLIGLFAVAAYRILPSINRMMAALLNVKEYQFTVDVVSQIKQDANWDNYYQLPAPEPALDFQKQISVENLSFHYKEGDNILENISFSIQKGETIGVVGKSGSGKTTFINILLRFLTEKSGTIKVDDIVLKDSNTDAWRKLIGYVQQEVYLIDASLAENIAFGFSKEEIDYPKLERVLESASLTEVVAKLPKGLDTTLGERGTQLSGGQRQRVGIARALYSDAQVLFFDEATSALDNETEEEITEAIRKLAENDLTMIIIAHRYSTLKYCDKIIELEKGKIQGIYNYQEIIQRVLN